MLYYSSCMTAYTVVLSIFTCLRLAVLMYFPFWSQISRNKVFSFSPFTRKTKQTLDSFCNLGRMRVVQMIRMANVPRNAFPKLSKELVKPDVSLSSKSGGESVACRQNLWLECYLTTQSVTPPCHAVFPSPVLMLNALSFLSMDRLNTSVIGCSRLKHCRNVLYNISINTCLRHWRDKMDNDCSQRFCSL